jgi:hypothetical protein
MEVLEATGTVTVQHYVDILNGLYEVQHLPGLNFAQKVLDNIEALEKDLLPLNHALSPSKEFIAFSERVRTEAGNDPERITTLEMENPEIVNERKEQLKTVQLMLQEPMDIQLRTIYQEELPKEITAHQLKGIRKIVK